MDPLLHTKVSNVLSVIIWLISSTWHSQIKYFFSPPRDFLFSKSPPRNFPLPFFHLIFFPSSPVSQLSNQGLKDVRSPFVKDGLCLYGIISDYVEEYVGACFSDDQEMLADNQICTFWVIFSLNFGNIFIEKFMGYSNFF